jgi:hypothetical protein
LIDRGEHLLGERFKNGTSISGDGDALGASAAAIRASHRAFHAGARVPRPVGLGRGSRWSNVQVRRSSWGRPTVRCGLRCTLGFEFLQVTLSP